MSDFKNVAVILSEDQIDYAIELLMSCRDANAKSAVVFSTKNPIDEKAVKSIKDLPNPDWFQFANLTIVGLPVTASQILKLMKSVPH